MSLRACRPTCWTSRGPVRLDLGQLGAAGAPAVLEEPVNGHQRSRSGDPADPGPALRRGHDLRREGSGHVLSADRADPAARRARRTSSSSSSTTPASARNSAFGGPCRTPTFERLAAERPQVHPLPHHRAVLADARGAAVRPQPPHRRHGRHHRDRRRRRPATARCGPTRAPRWPRRSSSTATRRRSSASATRCRSGRPARWARSTTGRASAAASSTSTASSAARRTSTHPALYDGTTPVEPDRTPEEGYHLTEDLDRPGDRLGPPAEVADAGQAVLRVLRARRDPRAAPRAAGVVGQVQGPVRPGLGRAARGDLRAPEGARRDPAGRRADGAAGRDPRLGRHARRR